MLENNIILDSKIKCQNCGITLALRSSTDETVMIASDIEHFEENPNQQVKIITMKCKKCGCFLQVKEKISGIQWQELVKGGNHEQ